MDYAEQALLWENVKVMFDQLHPKRTAIISHHCGEYTLRVFDDGDDRGPWPRCEKCGRYVSLYSTRVD